MKRLGTSAALALVFVLGIVSSVQASMVTITLEVGSTTLNVGEETDFTVYAAVTGNPALEGFLPGLGLEGASLNLIQSNANVEIVEGIIPFPSPHPSGNPAASLNKAQFTGLSNLPGYRNAANKRGLANFFVSNSFTKGFDDLDPITFAPAPFLLLGNTDVGGEPIWLVKGKIKGVAPGQVELNTEIKDLLFVYKDVGDASALTQGPADENIFVPTIVTVTGGEAPTADADGPYGEDDWPMTPPGWNNPARTIALDGTGSAGMIDTYEWAIAPPVSGDFMPLATGPTPDVSIQAIADALGIAVGELPGPYGPGVPDPTIYEYRLMLTVTGDGASNSDETTLFVPEPGTLVLLGLGGLAALIRRRRS